MPGLVPGIHVLMPVGQRRGWAGSKPGHDGASSQAEKCSCHKRNEAAYGRPLWRADADRIDQIRSCTTGTGRFRALTCNAKTSISPDAAMDAPDVDVGCAQTAAVAMVRTMAAAIAKLRMTSSPTCGLSGFMPGRGCPYGSPA